MKSFLYSAVLVSVFTAASALAHHPAADIVDEEIYVMIDSMVLIHPMQTWYSPIWAAE